MSFPEWGYSYNALCVPLTSDWQCALLPVRDMGEPTTWWSLSYDERQQKRKEREAQIEQDRRDFDRLFRVSTGRRAARACSDFSVYAAFISEHLRISGLGAPVDGEGVTRILRDAVRDGALIPAINRAWRGSRRVRRLYAPQSWPKRAPDPKQTVYALRDGQFMPLTTDGRLMDNTSFAPAAARVAASVGSSSGGKGWLAAVEAAAAALPGDDANSDDDDTADDSIIEGDFTGEAADDSTPLGDAQPFDYTPDSLGDAEQDAGVFLTPAEEMECETQYEADMAECSAYAAMDRSSWGMCKERAMNRYASCLRGMG